MRSGLFGWLPGAQQVEVLASADVQVPCRLPAHGARIVAGRALPPAALPAAAGRVDVPPESRSLEGDFRARFRAAVNADTADPPSLVEELSRPQPRTPVPHLPEAAFRLFTDLIDAEIQEDLARELIDRACQAAGPRDRADPLVLKARLARMLEEELRVCGPIVVRPGETRIVAVVGPTGVGKTTTVAKLAAN
ncbi:MAG: hypothetical protein MUF25_27715, partial [Pirellulaceae bacterium]|nr:hypothetical protein [Pirellulaceae bacterium]